MCSYSEIFCEKFIKNKTIIETIKNTFILLEFPKIDVCFRFGDELTLFITYLSQKWIRRDPSGDPFQEDTQPCQWRGTCPSRKNYDPPAHVIADCDV